METTHTDRQLERERRETQSIANVARKGVLQWMMDNPDWIQHLSDSERAKIMAPFIPKEKPIDQEFEARALSLVEALGQLPDQPEQSKQAAALSAECQRLRAENLLLEKVNKAYCNDNAGVSEFMDAIQSYIKEIRRYYRGIAKDFMDLDEMEQVLKDIRKGW